MFMRVANTIAEAAANIMSEGNQLMRRRGRVVIVDDDPAVCGSLKFSLELEGFAVRTYGSGAELLHAGDFAGCDCFVVDQRMPGMSGMELIARLQEQEPSTPAILIISHPSPALSARAAKAGVPIVEKPFLSNTLVEKIREFCQRGEKS